jgi:hypothetical protein
MRTSFPSSRKNVAASFVSSAAERDKVPGLSRGSRASTREVGKAMTTTRTLAHLHLRIAGVQSAA